MFEMKNKGLKDVDMIHQLGQLYHLLDDVINHAKNNDCFGTVKLIIYDGNILYFTKVIITNYDCQYKTNISDQNKHNYFVSIQNNIHLK